MPYSIVKDEKKHNEEKIEKWSKENKERDYFWASDIGKPYFDIYHRMIGTKPDNPIGEFGLGKIEAGNLYEDAFIKSLKDRGVKLEQQLYVEIPENKNHLKITGLIDAVIEHNVEKIPIEVKSVNSQAFWYTEKWRDHNWYDGFYKPYFYQLYTYVKAKGYPYGLLLIISRDDTTKKEIVVRADDKKIGQDYNEWLKKMSEYYRAKKEPPKPEIYSEGKKYNRSTRKYDTVQTLNKEIEFSPFRERIVGMKWEEHIKKANEQLKNNKKGKK